jgi:hypothetical protein
MKALTDSFRIAKGMGYLIHISLKLIAHLRHLYKFVGRETDKLSKTVYTIFPQIY